MLDPEALQLSSSLNPSAEDLNAAMTVMTAAFPPEFGEAWTLGQLSSMLTLPGAILVVGRLADTPVGFGLLRSIIDEAELLLLAIHPDQREKGHGRRLLDRCMSEAEGCGSQAMFLEVRSGNPAVHLYRKAGFHQYNIRKDYYVGSNGTRHDALSYKTILRRD